MNNSKLQYRLKDLDITLNLLTIKSKRLFKLKDISLVKCTSKWDYNYENYKNCKNIYLIKLNKSIPNYKKYEIILNSSLLTYWLYINKLKFNRTNILKFPLLSANDEFTDSFDLAYKIFNHVSSYGISFVDTDKSSIVNILYRYFDLLVIEYYFSQYVELDFELTIYKDIMIYYIDGKDPYNDEKTLMSLYRLARSSNSSTLWIKVARPSANGFHKVIQYAYVTDMSKHLNEVNENDN